MFISKTEIIVRCLKCGVKNRIRVEDAQKKAICGGCGASVEEIIIPCLHCGRKNRVGENAVTGRPPRCGACGKPLLNNEAAPHQT